MTTPPDTGSAIRQPISVLMLARVLDAGGIERAVSQFARHLLEQGIQPHVGCFNPGGMRWREIEAAGIPVLPVPVKSFRSKSAIEGARVMRDYIVEQDIRLVHAFDVPADIFAVPLTRVLRVPVLSTQQCYRDLSPFHIRLIMALIDRMAAGVLVNCEALADHLCSDWKLGRNRIHVCNNGYEPEEFHCDNRKRPPALAGASTVIGTVAVLRPEKNLKILIEAFARVHQIDRQTRLVIVGSGPVKAELMRQAASLQVADECIFQDAVSKPAEWMRAIDVFVLSSTTEGSSNSLLEAMACGCCPVASRVGGSPELIRDREHGVLFKSGNVDELTDALVNLVRHPEERQRIAESAAAFAKENLTIRQACKRLADIYRGLIGDARTKASVVVSAARSVLAK
jgi:glycosyltransferase involved in cell wall biosynthesis